MLFRSRRRTVISAALACALTPSLLWASQREETLADNVASTMRRSVNNVSPARLVFSTPQAGRQWLYEMSARLAKFIPDARERETILINVQYEAKRAGLDVQLILGLIEVESMFRRYAISGVGARTALAILSGMSVADLAQAVAAQETARLVKVPGIGKKTAERLLLELKGKLGEVAMPAAGTGATTEAQQDILQALLALGYSDKEASAALKALPGDIGVSEGIRQALRALAR